jgi:hypothetical protein
VVVEGVPGPLGIAELVDAAFAFERDAATVEALLEVVHGDHVHAVEGGGRTESFTNGLNRLVRFANVQHAQFQILVVDRVLPWACTPEEGGEVRE